MVLKTCFRFKPVLSSLYGARLVLAAAQFDEFARGDAHYFLEGAREVEGVGVVHDFGDFVEVLAFICKYMRLAHRILFRFSGRT